MSSRRRERPPGGRGPSRGRRPWASGGAASSLHVDPPAASTAPAAGSVDVFVDLVDCQNVGGSGIASGTIANHADQPTAYRIRIAFLDPGGAQAVEGAGDTAAAAPGAAVDWSVTVDGLGDLDVSCRTLGVTAIEGGGATSAPVAADEYPCTLLLHATVEQLAGGALEPGDASTTLHDEDGVQWTAAECGWPSFGQGAIEVDLEITKADGFPSGTVGCPPLTAATGTVDGPGAPATWAWTDPGTQTTVGTLRVCDPTALVDVRVDGPVGEAALKAAAVGLAKAALAAP